MLPSLMRAGGLRQRVADLRQQSIRHVEANLPIEWDLSLKARRGYVISPLDPLDVEPLALIRKASDEELADSKDLARIVQRLGLSNDRPDYFSEQMQDSLGKGLRIWQYPQQLAPYLCAIGQQGVETYLEIGVQHGGTFALTVEYLSRLGTLKRADAVDFMLAPTVAAMSQRDAGIQPHRMNSSSLRFKRLVRERDPIDLALIDGDHSTVGCMMDFEAIEDHVRTVAFHDIVDPTWGVEAVWNELKRSQGDRWEFQEFTKQFPEIEKQHGHPLLGIGLMVKR